MRFFFNDAATTEVYTLSLHDALPILRAAVEPPVRLDGGADQRLAEVGEVELRRRQRGVRQQAAQVGVPARLAEDRKSTRLNSSHANISYAVFCLNKHNTAMASAPGQN